MALSIAMTGSGTLGPVVDGWEVTEQCTPVALGDASGSVGGSETLQTKVKSDSRYVQDNPVTLTHDSAGTFHGSVQSVAVDNLTARPVVSGGLGFLVADRTMPPVWLDNTADHSFLVYGSGTGQVAQAGAIAVDPFDNSIFVTSWGTANGVDRYKVIKFSSAGVFISEFGANGTSNGQFTGWTYVAVSPVDGSVFVSDGSQTRIQKFTTADRITYTYSTKWGSNGSGDGAFGGTNNTFNIACDSSGNVFAADRGNQRIQKFNSSGTFQSKISTASSGPVASGSPYGIAVDASNNVYVSVLTSLSASGPGTITKYNNALSSLTSTLTIAPPTTLASVNIFGLAEFAIDSSGNIWAHWFGATYLIKYDSTGKELFRWQSGYPVPTDVNTNYAPAINSAGAVVTLFRTQTGGIPGYYVTEFNYVPVTLSTALQRYMLACDPTLNGFTFSYTASSNPNVVIPGWTGDVWTKLKEACCVYAVEIALVGTVITVRDAGSLTLNISNATPKTTTPSNTFGGQEVDITAQNPVAGGGVMYSAAAAGVQWSVDVGQTNQVTVTGDTYPTTLGTPIPTSILPIQPGQYYVIDSTGLNVPPASWTGSILVAVGDSPGTINITFIGPPATIPGFTGPFYFATDRTPTAVGTILIVGNGVTCTPTLVPLLTGADPARTTQQIAYATTTPFLDTVTRAYDRGIWSSDYFAAPAVQIEFDMPTADTNGFGQTAGATFTVEGTKYRVTEARFGNATTHITAARYTKLAEIDTVWSGQTLGTYDTFWTGYSAGDQQIQPLLTSR
jgi:hypothetical protein